MITFFQDNIYILSCQYDYFLKKNFCFEFFFEKKMTVGIFEFSNFDRYKKIFKKIFKIFVQIILSTDLIPIFDIMCT